MPQGIRAAAGAGKLVPTKCSQLGQVHVVKRKASSVIEAQPQTIPVRRASIYTSPLPDARHQHRAFPTAPHGGGKLRPTATNLTAGTTGHRAPAGQPFKCSVCMWAPREGSLAWKPNEGKDGNWYTVGMQEMPATQTDKQLLLSPLTVEPRRLREGMSLA